MHEIVTQTKRCFQTGRKIKRTLVIETQIALRSMEQTRSSHIYIDRNSISHCRRHCMLHLTLDNITDRLRQCRTEFYRTICLQPHMGEECTLGKMPETEERLTTLKCELLSNRILQLILLQAQIISRKIILIHLHIVIQELIAGSRSKIPFRSFMTKIDTRKQHVAAINPRECSIW